MTPPHRPTTGRPRPDWVVQAACRAPGVRMDDFYPEQNRDPKAATQRAKAVCAPCAVRAECLAWGDLISEEWGIFSGLTSSERRNRRARLHSPEGRAA